MTIECVAPTEPGDIADKFLTARRYHRPSLTQEGMGEVLGLSHAMISRYENGARVPPGRMVEKAARLLRIPIDWFYDGQPGPPPFLPESTRYGSALGSAPPAPGNEAHRVAQPGVGRRKFPLVGSAGAASFPIPSVEPWPGDFVEFSDDLFREERFAIQVTGDSMKPRLEHGEYVLVQPSSQVERGLLAVVKNGDHEYVVKVLRVVEGAVQLHPINEDYEVIIPDGSWQIVGYAVGRRQERGIGRYIEEGDNAGLRP